MICSLLGWRTCITHVFTESVMLAADSGLCISKRGFTRRMQWECYPECFFVILTQCYCVSASRILSQINFEDADCSMINTLCQVLMARCAIWVENQRREGKHEMRLSYLKKHFSTSNCKEKERNRGEAGEGGGHGRKRLKLDYHRVQINNFSRHFTRESAR